MEQAVLGKNPWLCCWCSTAHSPSVQVGSCVQHSLSDFLLLAFFAEVRTNDWQEFFLSGSRHAVIGTEKGTSGRSHLPPSRILQHPYTVLTALWGRELIRQLLLQEAIVHVRRRVTGSAQQQDIMGVVVLHLSREVAPVLMWNDVLSNRERGKKKIQSLKTTKSSALCMHMLQVYTQYMSDTVLIIRSKVSMPKSTQCFFSVQTWCKTPLFHTPHRDFLWL